MPGTNLTVKKRSKFYFLKATFKGGTVGIGRWRDDGENKWKIVSL